MPKRLTLLALWAVFAVAAVGVGFAAAGLVDDPFTDGRVTADGPVQDAGQDSSSPSASSSPSSTTAPSSSPPATQGSSRELQTRGGLVSARCSNGLVSVSAAPAVGWVLDSRTSGRVRNARVRFEPAKDANGERIEVNVRCAGGRPDFSRDDKGSGGGGSDDGGGGSDDNGGGGSDDNGGGGGGGGDD